MGSCRNYGITKNGKYTIRQKHRGKYKTTRGIAREQLRYEKKEKDHLHLLLTDLAACYDCIPYTTIQLCVTRIGLPDNFLKLIRGLQEQQHRSLRFNGNPPSPLFLLTGGLAQGCGLSCILLVCITAAIITYTQDRTNKGTTKCHCHHPLLGKVPQKGPAGPRKEKTKATCRCDPYKITGPCLHVEQCKSCKKEPNKNCKNPHCNRCPACLGLTGKHTTCTHTQCPNTCPHR